MDDASRQPPWPADERDNEPISYPPPPHYGPTHQVGMPTPPSSPQDVANLPTVPIRMPDGSIETTGVVPGQAIWQPDSSGAGGAAQGPQRRRGISRRGVLIGAGLGLLGLGAVGVGAGLWFSRPDPQVLPLPSLDDAANFFHLLRRAGFGARPGEIGEYIGLGLNGSIDRLLNPASVADDLDARLNALQFDFNLPRDLQRWFLLRMIYTKKPLEEKMTLFWHGVLTSSFKKVGGPSGVPLLKQQDDLLRAKGMGRLDDLISAITTDPAMLWWLDGRVNTAVAPNENYARELMELFVLGLTNAQGAANYTQDDVEGGAHALTGWVVKRGGVQSKFVPQSHDEGIKTFLGQTGNLGVSDVVRIVCNHPSAGWHLAKRLWTFFVYENPSASDLQPLIDAYNREHHSIAAVVRAMLTSPRFFSAQAHRSRVKSPIEFVVGAVRALEVEVGANDLGPVIALMGQNLFDPPNVSGWDGDKVSANWVSTQAWMTRLNFINDLLAVATSSARPASNAGQGNTSAAHPAPTATLAAAPPLQQLINSWKPASPQALLDFFVAFLLDNQMGSDRQGTINDFMNAHLKSGGPALTLNGGAKLPALAARGALYLLMTAPEYHLN